MRRRTRWWITRASRATAVAAAALGGACASSEGEAPRAEAVDAQAGRIVNVEVTAAVPTTFTDYLRITGEVEALHDVRVAAEEAGVVDRFYVVKGQRVAAGAPIAKLDDGVLAAQVAEARAQARLAAETHERQRRLWEEERMGSEIAYLQAKYAAEQAAARLATLEARLERTVIRAPVTGIFDEQFLEAGEMATAGAPVARIVALDRVKIVGGVPERFALAVRAGDPARVTLDVLPGREFTGRISFVGARVDDQSRTIPIEIEMVNPDGLVKPRMVANVQIVRARLDGVLVVPQQVVTRTERGYQLFVVAERDGALVAEARDVRVGPTYGNRVVIEEGLAAGDRVITLGHRLVDDGSRVRIVQAGGTEG